MTTLIDLRGQVALVTGSSRGIGRAVAESLAAAGSDVILNARTHTDDIAELATTIATTHGVRCEVLVADVSRVTDVNSMFQAAFRSFRRLNVLVNNAGILIDGLIGMISQEDMQSTIATNTLGTLNCIQAGSRLLQRSGGGSIINISSIIAVHGNAGQLVYGASKGAIISATLSSAKELAQKGIRVNAIAPGYIGTEMIKSIPEDTHRQRLASIAMGRIGTPEDVADVVLFLASPLSRYVTGTVIGVDGGMVI